MAESKNGSPATTAATEVVTQVVRNAAAEVIKGDQSLDRVVRTVVGDAVRTIEARGPAFAEDAGILNWRYAVLGWVTWNVGKRVVKRKAKDAVTRRREPAVETSA
jgi:hypothetical protein